MCKGSNSKYFVLVMNGSLLPSLQSMHILSLLLNYLWNLLVWNTIGDDSTSDTVFSSDTFLKDANRMGK